MFVPRPGPYCRNDLWSRRRGARTIPESNPTTDRSPSRGLTRPHPTLPQIPWPCPRHGSSHEPSHRRWIDQVLRSVRACLMAAASPCDLADAYIHRPIPGRHTSEGCVKNIGSLRSREHLTPLAHSFFSTCPANLATRQVQIFSNRLRCGPFFPLDTSLLNREWNSITYCGVFVLANDYAGIRVEQNW